MAVFQLPGTLKVDAATLFGLRLETSTDSQTPGQIAGWIDPMDRAEWTVNVPSAGTYSLVFRLAAAKKSSIQLRDANSKVLSSVAVPYMDSSWRKWGDVVAPNVVLPAGEQKLVLYCADSGYNIASITLNPVVVEKPKPVRVPGTIYFLGENIIQSSPNTPYTTPVKVYGATKETVGYQDSDAYGQDAIRMRIEYNDVSSDALKVKMLLVEVTINDLKNNRTNDSIVTDYTLIFDKAKSQGSAIYLLLSMPCSNATAEQCVQIDDLNKRLSTLVTSAAYSGKIIDPRPVVGKLRMGGPIGNLWDLNYSDNGFFLNEVGHEKYSALILEKLGDKVIKP